MRGRSLYGVLEDALKWGGLLIEEGIGSIAFSRYLALVSLGAQVPWKFRAFRCSKTAR